MDTRAALLCSAIVLGGASSALSAQAASGAGAADHRDWRVECRPGTCALSVTVRSASEEWLATLVIEMDGQAAPDDPALLRAVVPAGVHLASGLFLDIPGAPALEAAFVRCAAEACAATAPLDADAFAALRRARSATMRYRPGVTAPTIRFDVSLMGLTAAWRDANAALQ